VKILVISLKGLGDTLFYVPVLKILSKELPSSDITILVPNQTCANILHNEFPKIRIIVFDFRKIMNIFSNLLTLISLRLAKFDISISTFPSNRVWYNLFAFMAGAKKRITHSYAAGKYKTLAFLQTHLLPAELDHHSIEQNIKLLKFAGIEAHLRSADTAITIKEENLEYAKNYCKQVTGYKNVKLIGIHPSFVKGVIYKSWGSNNIEVIASFVDWIYTRFPGKVQVLLFAGNDEYTAVRKIKELSKHNPVIVANPDILQIAAIISRLNIFINTDSGLGHIAAALNIPSITIFGSANPVISRPYSKNNVLILNYECNSCYSYPFRSTKPEIKCKTNPKCMEIIAIDKVKTVLEKLMQNEEKV
jgi:heptosyltransferase-2